MKLFIYNYNYFCSCTKCYFQFVDVTELVFFLLMTDLIRSNVVFEISSALCSDKIARINNSFLFFTISFHVD